MTGDSITEKRLREQASELQESYRLRVAIPDAVRGDHPLAGLAEAGHDPAVLAAEGHRYGIWFGALLGVVGLLALRQFAPETIDSIFSNLNPWTPASADSSMSNREEDRAFAEFLVAFKAGPPVKPQTRPSGDPLIVHPVVTETKADHSQENSDPVKHFFTHAAERLLAARNRLQEIGRGPENATRQKLLEELCAEVHNLKGMAGVPELLPAWQVASTLESLLKQLVAKPNRVTLSTLRSIATGLDVLADLCRPGVDAHFCANPAPRFLAVDDDSISRHAVSLALKKAFNQPDVASNGEAALALISKHAYDAIFLDVVMPGMDGFQLCSKIHETLLNRNTPVVFVTCRSDFDARAQSGLCGGSDLLEKPFLTFEITLKALTVAMRSRLQARSAVGEALVQSPPASTVSDCGSEKEALV